jgi:CubicO group peptidase (beta-lactamase class C family)
MHFPGKRKVGCLTSTRRAFLGGVAIVIGAGAARGAETEALGELVASFDAQRQVLGVPSISVALVEDGRINLVQRGVKSASIWAPVGPGTHYQAASMSKTVAAITALSLSTAG